MKPLRTPLIRASGAIGLAAAFLSFCLLRFESFGSSRLLIALNLALWIALTVLYPVAAVRAGVVITEPGAWGYNKREAGPGMFWANLIVITLAFALLTVLVAVASYHAW